MDENLKKSFPKYLEKRSILLGEIIFNFLEIFDVGIIFAFKKNSKLKTDDNF